MNLTHLLYTVDSNDTITEVSDNWTAFANDNAWNAACRPEEVVGKKLWGFIQGIETRYLYKELFQRVRSGSACGPIPFRCDSPQERRFLELVLAPSQNGQIEITSTILRTERRAPVALLDSNAPQSNDEKVTICSLCKKMETPHAWIEIEAGLTQQRIFESSKMPRVTHGLCPECYRITLAQLDDERRPLRPRSRHG